MGDKQSDSRVIVVKNCSDCRKHNGGFHDDECPLGSGVLGDIPDNCPLPRTSGAIKALEDVKGKAMDYKVACYGCGGNQGLMMVAHRNTKGAMVGWIFVCGKCFESVKGVDLVDRKEIHAESVVKVLEEVRSKMTSQQITKAEVPKHLKTVGHIKMLKLCAVLEVIDAAIKTREGGK
jgi:hypothetical protein